MLHFCSEELVGDVPHLNQLAVADPNAGINQVARNSAYICGSQGYSEYNFDGPPGVTGDDGKGVTRPQGLPGNQ